MAAICVLGTIVILLISLVFIQLTIEWWIKKLDDYEMVEKSEWEQLCLENNSLRKEFVRVWHNLSDQDNEYKP